MSDPRWVRLEELTEPKRPITYGVVKPGPEPESGGVILIRGGDIAGGRIAQELRRITEDVSRSYRRTLLRGGELVMSLVGNPGAVAIVPSSLADANLARQAALVALRSDVDPRYVMYWFMSPLGRQRLAAVTKGSVQQVINLADLKRQEVLLPSLEIQRRIASILGAYDDLIEANRRRVAILEEMARGLFEEWFVRLRFPGHEVAAVAETPDGRLPQGWRYVGLHDVADVAFGFAFKSKAFTTDPVGTRVVRIRDVPEGKTSTWTSEPVSSRYDVVNGDILVGMDGIFHTAMWIGGAAALNQRVARLRPQSGHSHGWLFNSVLPHIKFFEATISGTTVAHLGAKHLSTIRVRVADPSIQQQADRFFSALDNELITIRVANERLAASRDLLLPRLISGQLSVEAAERELEDAA